MLLAGVAGPHAMTVELLEIDAADGDVAARRRYRAVRDRRLLHSQVIRVVRPYDEVALAPAELQVLDEHVGASAVDAKSVVGLHPGAARRRSGVVDEDFRRRALAEKTV